MDAREGPEPEADVDAASNAAPEVEAPREKRALDRSRPERGSGTGRGAAAAPRRARRARRTPAEARVEDITGTSEHARLIDDDVRFASSGSVENAYDPPEVDQHVDASPNPNETRRDDSPTLSHALRLAMACPSALRAPPATGRVPARAVRPRASAALPRRAPSPPAPRRAVSAAAGSADDLDLGPEDIDLEFVGGEFVVEAFDDAGALATALCLEVQENAKACIEERGAFTFAVPGGSVAKSLKGLADLEDVDWGKVHLFFVNERVPGSKCLDLAMDTWARACGIPEANVHAVLGDEPKAAAAAYETQMRDLDRTSLPVDEANGLPVFDLILLGMGADGHVGSIYPESETLDDESGAAVLGVEMPSKRSVTMSMALINTADRVVVAASGAGKAETVRLALEDEECRLPGALCDAFSQIWFLDKDAASKLQAYEEMDEE